MHSKPSSCSVKIYSPSVNLTFSASTCKFAFVFTAELIAIYIAVLCIISSRNKNNEIFQIAKVSLMRVVIWLISFQVVHVSRLLKRQIIWLDLADLGLSWILL